MSVRPKTEWEVGSGRATATYEISRHRIRRASWPSCPLPYHGSEQHLNGILYQFRRHLCGMHHIFLGEYLRLSSPYHGAEHLQLGVVCMHIAAAVISLGAQLVRATAGLMGGINDRVLRRDESDRLSCIMIGTFEGRYRLRYHIMDRNLDCMVSSVMS